MLTHFKADMKRCSNEIQQAPKFVFLLFELALYAVFVFRVTKEVQKIRYSFVRKPLSLMCFIASRFAEIITGVRVSSDSEIGPGVLIHNHGGIVIHGDIGENFTICQGAQMISSGNGRGEGWPIVGNNVFISSGAKLLGKICVGDCVKVGANAVVMRDVPAHSLVMPPESRMVKSFYRKES